MNQLPKLLMSWPTMTESGFLSDKAVDPAQILTCDPRVMDENNTTTILLTIIQTISTLRDGFI